MIHSFEEKILSSYLRAGNRSQGFLRILLTVLKEHLMSYTLREAKPT